MKRTLRRSILALCCLLVPITGCETREIWMQLPSFDSSNVQGIWLWRRSETADTYQRACRIEFGVPALVQGRETLSYVQACGGELQPIRLSAELERDPSDPETVILGFWYVRLEEAGSYKVSAYSGDGESALSGTAVDL